MSPGRVLWTTPSFGRWPMMCMQFILCAHSKNISPRIITSIQNLRYSDACWAGLNVFKKRLNFTIGTNLVFILRKLLQFYLYGSFFSIDEIIATTSARQRFGWSLQVTSRGPMIFQLLRAGVRPISHTRLKNGKMMVSEGNQRLSAIFHLTSQRIQGIISNSWGTSDKCFAFPLIYSRFSRNGDRRWKIQPRQNKNWSKRYPP